MEPIRDNEEFKGAIRTSKRAKKGQKGRKWRKGLFLKETAVLTHFFVGKTQSLLNFLHVRVPYGTNQIQWELKRAVRNIKKGQKR